MLGSPLGARSKIHGSFRLVDPCVGTKGLTGGFGFNRDMIWETEIEIHIFLKLEQKMSQAEMLVSYSDRF
jgi:hypothetical protein